MLFDILAELERRGHRVRRLCGLSQPADADLAILHVDATIVPQAYVDYAARFPFCLNLAVADISKCRISQALLSDGGGWSGPVIVKSNLNHHGLPEALQSARRAPRPPAAFSGRARNAPPRGFRRTRRRASRASRKARSGGGQIHARNRRRWFRHPHLGVLRDARTLRALCLAQRRGETIRREPVPVPDEMRLLRQKLGFDYGKFDFVKSVRSMLVEAAANLADGFEGMMGRGG
jgi:hypothetical protein